MKIKTLPLTLLLVSMSVNSASAQLYLNEDFESYPEGEIAHVASKTSGFTGVWSGSGGAYIVKGEAGNVLSVPASGKWTGIGFDLSGETSGFYGRSGILYSIPGDQIYISFVMKMGSVNVEGSQALVGFMQELDTSTGLMLGQMWSQSNFSGGSGKPSAKPLDTKEHLFVIELSRAGDSASVANVYIDPENPAEVALSKQTPSMTLWPKDQDLKFFGVKANGNPFTIDTLKIGNSAQSVFP